MPSHFLKGHKSIRTLIKFKVFSNKDGEYSIIFAAERITKAR